MTSRREFILSGSAALAWAAASPFDALAAADPSRVALVIGNDRYRASPLGNAANDAKAMAQLLEGAGFRVDARTDATAQSLAEGVARFGEAIARPEVKLAVFYYAGHGVQVDWRNYLLPVDANVASAAELKSQCVDLGILLASMAKAQGKEFVIMLDACRDNPFGAGWRPEQKGLSQFDAPVGSLIAFSTAPGSVASDGGGQHGLYTENLVRELAVKGTKIEDALKRVRVNVRLASKGAQIPWESTSLEDDVVIYPAEGKPAPVDPERRFEEELARWNRVRTSRNPEDWAAFVREFPDGKFSEIAQTRLNDMLATREQGRGRRQSRAIEIDASHPVPAFLAKSANPYSAGTYPLDRAFKVGDRATYQEVDPESGAPKRQFTQRVSRVNVEEDRVEFNGGGLVTDLLGNPIKAPGIEYDVPVQMNPAELQVGKRWSARFHASKRIGEADVDMEYEIVGRERVSVPAGEFDAFRIEGRGRSIGEKAVEKQRGLKRARHGKPQGQAVTMTLWDVPGLNFVVKRERTYRNKERQQVTERFELVALHQGK